MAKTKNQKKKNTNKLAIKAIKKDEIYFSNIEEGTFKEEIKISVDKFQLKSTKFQKMEDDKGVYKYYFNLIVDDPSSDEENR